jgi:hypothetical protein
MNMGNDQCELVSAIGWYSPVFGTGSIVQIAFPVAVKLAIGVGQFPAAP